MLIGKRDFMASIAREPDGGAGGAAPAPALVAAAAAAAPAAAAAAAPAAPVPADPAAAAAVAPAAPAPAAPAVYYPEGLPDTFRGATERETIDKLAADVMARPKPPEKPDGYTLALPKELSERFGDMKDDPVLPLWREVAHELGLDDKAFNGAFAKLYSKMADKGLIEDPVSVEAELAKLAPAAGDAKQKSAEAIRRVNDAVAWTKGQFTRGEIDAGMAAKLGDMAATADGVRALEWIVKKSGGGVQPGGNPAGGGPAGDPLKLMFPTHFQ